MPTADGRVATPRASRYLVQLCRHADRMSGHQHLSGHVRHGADSPQVRHSEWTDADGVLELDRGRCTLHVTPDALLVHIDAPEDETLRRIQDLITARLEGFGRRDGLQVQWHHPPSAPPDDGAPAAPDAPVTPQVVLRAGRRHLPVVVPVLAGVLVVAVHLGLLGALLAAPGWARGVAGLVVAGAVVKILLVIVVAVRRRRLPLMVKHHR